ncbi:glycine/D-amino acid oxidase-like deaminating enzyme [Halomonas campaniensis]|uniref:Glycine/D-amino acid oxidase-like deaminating enzyme n=1 Tax=Halomonas campaniensis TaxID=213554 RepID=A0A7W5P9Q8_9GAMM|nr:FAD-binding oxidoreductase [Halomonas campaniensis]MBB3329959.1 glycine/D-amino acid oxidase-like deaminating enzyme [Halomonas campaniensis]
MSEPLGPSYYAASIVEASGYPRLEGEHRVDVAIVGGGFTGVATAVELAERGYRVAVVEANRIGWGASGRNGGQVTGSLSGEATMRRQMRRTLGEEAADFIWHLRWRGHEIIRRRVETYAIRCDLKHGHLQAAWQPSHLAALRDDFEACQAHGMGDHVAWLDRDRVGELLGTRRYHGALRNDYNMHLHPLNLCLGEARAAAGLGALIFEDSPVMEITHGAAPAVVTERGRVVADSVILAGNAYHRLERRRLGGRLFPASLGIVATAPLDAATAAAINPEDLAVYDTRFVLDYYRLTADRRLLFGGGANYSGRHSPDIAAELRPRLEHTFPQLEGVAIDFAWQGMAGIVINRVPMLGRLSPNVYYAQGYSGHGIATSHIVGEILAEAVGGSLEAFDAFAEVRHWRVPFGDRLGNALLAAGMGYYRLRERLR